jgi:recombination protein RecA
MHSSRKFHFSIADAGPTSRTSMAAKTEPIDASSARKRDLDLILQTIVKEYGDGAIMRLGDSHKMQVESIPTGNILIDRALGVGGFP